MKPSRLLFIPALLCLLTPFLSAQDQDHDPSTPWTGNWNSTYGQLRLTQEGDRVYGDYSNRGHFEARTREDLPGVLRGTFQRNDGKWGFIQFILSETKDSFSGAWAYEKFPAEGTVNWRATRTSLTPDPIVNAVNRDHYWADPYAEIDSPPDQIMNWISGPKTDTDTMQKDSPPMQKDAPADQDTPAPDTDVDGAYADHFQTPEKLAAAIFTPYTGDGNPVIPPPVSSAALPDAPTGYLHLDGPLANAVQSYFEAIDEKPELAIGFDPLIDGQDYDITDFKIHPAEVSETPSGRRPGLVVVTFKNLGEPREIWLGVEDVGGERPWKLTAIRAEKGHEGRKYDLYQVLENAAYADDQASTQPASPDFSADKSERADLLLHFVKMNDPALAGRLKSEFEPLGHLHQEGRVVRRCGEYGDTPIGNSAVPPFITLWRKKQPQPGEPTIFELQLHGETLLLDERGKPLVVNDPNLGSFNTKPVITEVRFEPTPEIATIAPNEAQEETLGHYLFSRPMDQIAEMESFLIPLKDRPAATLALFREGHLVSGIEFTYLEKDYSGWRFTSRTWASKSPNTFLVEMLDKDGSPKTGESTSWIIFRNTKDFLLTRHNQGTLSDDRRIWPEVKLRDEPQFNFFHAFTNLPSVTFDNPESGIPIIESLVENWAKLIAP
ncbi:hypothetical protein FEM03_21920 [Phragmitibacter flavus]|uniref:Uncharacterized protein n=1 Tax=Phragmitibacter flavus TaxID=2576071 RepID=A0A5R8KAM0_9BACT|nr:hypothetical protein [Phragmitibacter flavus]TLD68579.1 hypothetical protein FEM03_21920 [Phragmitibacter flavus]